MDVNFIFPVLLFSISIVFSLIVQNIKTKGISLKEIKKSIKAEADKSLKSLEQKSVHVEEQLNLNKIRAEEVYLSIDKKIKELNSHGDELAQLINSLNKYRNMLGQLNVSTNKTYEWVVKVNKDAQQLEKTQSLIQKMEKNTVDILKSFEEGINNQQTNFEKLNLELMQLIESNKKDLENSKNEASLEIENKLNSLKEFGQTQQQHFVEFSKEISELSSTCRDEITEYKNQALESVKEQVETLNSLKEEYKKLSSSQETLILEAQKEKESCKTSLDQLIEDFSLDREKIVNQTKEKVDLKVKDILDETKNSLSILNKDKLNEFESSIDNSTKESLIKVDENLQKTIRVINQYSEKLENENIVLNSNEVFEKEEATFEENNKEVEPKIIEEEKIEQDNDEKKDEEKSNFEIESKVDLEKSINDSLQESYTGFGSLLNSYKVSKTSQERESKEDKKEPIFKPGSILTQAVAQKDEEKKTDEEKIFYPTGEEEEILLD